MKNLPALARLYIGLLVGNSFMLAIIIIVYAESYSLVMDAFSWLGKFETSEGLTNVGAMVLFSGTLLVDAGCWLRGAALAWDTALGRSPVFKVLAPMVALGFVLMAFPCDVFVTVHSVGGGLLVGGCGLQPHRCYI